MINTIYCNTTGYSLFLLIILKLHLWISIPRAVFYTTLYANQVFVRCSASATLLKAKSFYTLSKSILWKSWNYLMLFQFPSFCVCCWWILSPLLKFSGSVFTLPHLIWLKLEATNRRGRAECGIKGLCEFFLLPVIKRTVVQTMTSNISSRLRQLLNVAFSFVHFCRSDS